MWVDDRAEVPCRWKTSCQLGMGGRKLKAHVETPEGKHRALPHCDKKG